MEVILTAEFAEGTENGRRGHCKYGTLITPSLTCGAFSAFSASSAVRSPYPMTTSTTWVWRSPKTGSRLPSIGSPSTVTDFTPLQTPSGLVMRIS